jgi:hypothetical protein
MVANNYRTPVKNVRDKSIEKTPLSSLLSDCQDFCLQDFIDNTQTHKCVT